MPRCYPSHRYSQQLWWSTKSFGTYHFLYKQTLQLLWGASGSNSVQVWIWFPWGSLAQVKLKPFRNEALSSKNSNHWPFAWTKKLWWLRRSFNNKYQYKVNMILSTHTVKPFKLKCFNNISTNMKHLETCINWSISTHIKSSQHLRTNYKGLKLKYFNPICFNPTYVSTLSQVTTSRRKEAMACAISKINQALPGVPNVGFFVGGKMGKIQKTWGKWGTLNNKNSCFKLEKNDGEMTTFFSLFSSCATGSHLAACKGPPKVLKMKMTNMEKNNVWMWWIYDTRNTTSRRQAFALPMWAPVDAWLEKPGAVWPNMGRKQHVFFLKRDRQKWQSHKGHENRTSFEV